MLPYFYSTLLNFAIVIFVVWYFTRKPATEMVKKRSFTIGDLIQKASLSSQESVALLNQWQTKFDQKEEEISLQKAEAKNLLARAKKTSGENILKEEDRIRKEAELFTKSEWSRSITQLEKNVLHQSLQLAKDHFTSNADEKDRQYLIQDYMEHAGNGKRK